MYLIFRRREHYDNTVVMKNYLSLVLWVMLNIKTPSDDQTRH